MEVVLLLYKLTLLLEPCDYGLVRILDEYALVVRNLVRELALIVYRTHDRDSGSLENIVVVLSKTWSGVYDSAAINSGDIVAKDSYECALVIEVCKVVEKRLIAHTGKLASLVMFKDFVGGRILVVGLKSRLAKVVLVASGLVKDEYIVYLRSQSQRQVGRKRPRSCSPCKEIRILSTLDLESYGYGRVRHILVAAKVDLHVRKRTSKTWAVWKDVVAFVYETLVVEGLEHPPDAFHEGLVHGLVAVVEVNPPSHSGYGMLPLVCELQDACAALVVVVLNPVFLDLLCT